MTRSKTIRLLEICASMALGCLAGIMRTAQLKKAGGPDIFISKGYSDSMVYIALGVFAVLAVVTAVFLSDAQKIKVGEMGILPQIFLAVSGAILLLAIVFMFMTGSPMSVFQIIQIPFLGFCALAILLRGLFGDSIIPRRVMSLFPVFYSCLLLLSFYRTNAKNPILSSFSYECVIIVVVTYSLYIAASINFERPKLKQQIVTTMLSVFTVSSLMTTVFTANAYLQGITGYSLPLVLTLLGFCIYICAIFFHAPLIDEGEKGGKRIIGAKDNKSVEETLVDMGMAQFPEEDSI